MPISAEQEEHLSPLETRWAALAKTVGRGASERTLRGMLRTSVPPALRPRVWMALSGAAAEVQPGLYEQLLAGQDSTRRTTNDSQIEIDLARSGLGDDEATQNSLRRVLRAFSSFRPCSGYVQGQNFIAAGLLRVLHEEDAFWLLAVIVEAYLPEHFTDHMLGSLIDCQLLAELLAKRMPDVSAKLAALEVPVQLLATRWFLSLWASVLPVPTLLRVSDLLFVLGPHLTPLVGLACFHVLRPSILAATHADELAASSCLQPLREAPPEQLISAILAHVGEPLKPSALEKMRAKARHALLLPPALGARPPATAGAGMGTDGRRASRSTALGQSLQQGLGRLASRTLSFGHKRARAHSAPELSTSAPMIVAGEGGGGEGGGGEGGGSEGGGTQGGDGGALPPRAPLGALTSNAAAARAAQGVMAPKAAAALRKRSASASAALAMPTTTRRSSTRTPLPVLPPVPASPLAPAHAHDDALDAAPAASADASEAAAARPPRMRDSSEAAGVGSGGSSGVSSGSGSGVSGDSGSSGSGTSSGDRHSDAGPSTAAASPPVPRLLCRRPLAYRACGRRSLMGAALLVGSGLLLGTLLRRVEGLRLLPFGAGRPPLLASLPAGASAAASAAAGAERASYVRLPGADDDGDAPPAVAARVASSPPPHGRRLGWWRRALHAPLRWATLGTRCAVRGAGSLLRGGARLLKRVILGALPLKPAAV